MTDEQIRQNAGEYASIGRGAFQTYDEYAQLRDAYIAGAHSRDEEVEQWKKSKRKLRLRLMQQIHDIHNPWVSVKDRLPEKAEGLYELEKDERHKMVLFKTGNGNLYRGYLDAEEIWRAFTVPYKGAIPIDSLTWSNVTHWMPIPELKKGE